MEHSDEMERQPLAPICKDGGSVALTLGSPDPQATRLEVLPPAAAYSYLALMGASKAKQHGGRIFLLGIMAGCYIAFGGFCMLSVGGNMPGERGKVL